MIYGELEFCDDDTGTTRSVISQLTTLRVAFAQSIKPTGTPTMMTMTQDASVAVYRALSVGGKSTHPTPITRTKLNTELARNKLL